MPGVMPTVMPTVRPRAHRRTWWALIAAVALLHLLTLDGLVEDRLGWGQGDKPPPRIEVTFVRELAQAAPPAVVARAAPPPAARRPMPVVSAASAPGGALASPVDQVAATAAAAAPEATVASAPGQIDVAAAPDLAPPLPALAAVDAPAEPRAVAVSAAPSAAPAASTGASIADTAAPQVAVAAPAALAAASASASAPSASFDWPPSTRLRFKLEGHYRGPINGSAQVDWLRAGQRYQVHLETSLGPVLSRHITSEGELTAAGLAPQRFDGEQHVLFRPTKRWGQRFTPERITLADGSEVAAQPGAQDEASQFVQLTWLFTTRPDLLQVGRSVDVPLALNRRLDVWTYDVVGQETLYLPFGQVDTFHVKPRREAGAGVMTAEIWFAPTLQTLPVRILIRQDSESWINLTLEKPPLQAAR